MTESTGIKHDDLVFDVGLHRGEDTFTYLAKGFRVVAFEADADLVASCAKLFADEIAAGQLTIVEGAIVGDTSQKTVTFYKNPVATIWGTTDPEWAARNERMGWSSEEITVDVVDMHKVLLKHGVPRYVKIDIEGADLVCLQKLGSVDVRPDYVSIESNKKSMEGIREEVDILTSLGYDRFKAVQQATVPKQNIPNPPLEGTNVVKFLPHDSSGLFGKELAGAWVSRDEILKQYERIMVGYRVFGNDSFMRTNSVARIFWKLLQKIARRPIPGWFDTHAKHSSVVD